MRKEFVSPVDCIHYEPIDVEKKARPWTPRKLINNVGLVKVGEVNATCLSPDRDGPVYGCVLVDFETGKHIPGAKCEFQIPKYTEEAKKFEADLGPEEFPF